MKLRLSTLGTFTVAALLVLAARPLHAQVTNIVTLNAAVKIEKAGTDNGIVTNVPPPDSFAFPTKVLLQGLAFDEFQAGRYPSNSFPAGAKLAEVNGEFMVLSKTGDVLVSVTNILTFTRSGTNDVFSGTISDQTGLARPTTVVLELATLSFDDTSIPGGVGFSFFLTGLRRVSITDSVPVGGHYTETRSISLSPGYGEGLYQGKRVVVTGTVKETGKAVLPVVL